MAHKWAKEIHAWADGAIIQCLYVGMLSCDEEWQDDEFPEWHHDDYEFRIKPTPKEPQYLYVYKRIDGSGMVWDFSDSPNESHPQWKCTGKIKLEQDE